MSPVHDTPGHIEARRLYPLSTCEWDGCERPAVDRHHRDGDSTNNSPENIARLCRKHHMEADGRLERFVAAGQHSPEGANPCDNCRRLYKPLRRGRCAACAKWLRLHGTERSVARPLPDSASHERHRARGREAVSPAGMAA